ncbi:ATP-binding cassette domain-containing protein [bacterium]|nr:ATP-binding cassette domain-containing protein [bacterium]
MNVIEVKDVWKKYRLHYEKEIFLKEMLSNLLRRRKYYDKFWALKGINIEIEKGETVGIIGKNGSGKTTILKLLSGITEPSKGSIKIKGRVTGLLELGAGFHPELTGRENIYLNGSILGLSRKEINQKMDSIISFADIGDFIDAQVKTYSAGMHLRLGFAIAAQVDPDILLIDEVLAVGDLAFQKKCFERIKELKKRGKTILFVSHSLNAIRKVCDRTIWLNEGKIEIDDVTEKAINFYLAKIRYEEIVQEEPLELEKIKVAPRPKKKIAKRKTKYQLPFDVFQRYKMAEEIINQLRTSKRLKILTLGENADDFSLFLPKDEIYTLNRKSIKKRLPFEDDFFDFAVSLDLIEHLPSKRREQFVSEKLRVSKDCLILGAPFENKNVKLADRILYDFLHSRYGIKYRFLQEHFRYGLPKLEEIYKFLDKRGLEYITLPNGYLYRWLFMILVHFTIEGVKGSFEVAPQIREFYNRNYYLYDNREPSYRKVILVSKKKRANLKPILDKYKTSKKNRVRRFELPDLFLKILSLAKIQEREKEIQKKENKIKTFSERIEDLNKYISYLEYKIGQ